MEWAVQGDKVYKAALRRGERGAIPPVWGREETVATSHLGCAAVTEGYGTWSLF